MSVGRKRRLLTIAHSYAVGVNRRLAHELATSGEWDVTAVGPEEFHGDFRIHRLEPHDGEACRVVPVPVHFNLGGRVHAMLYGGAFAPLLSERWDLVHCWEEPYVAAAWQVARRLDASTPLVFATFQNITKRYPPPFNWIEQYAMRRADGVIAFGQTVAETLARRGFDRVPQTVIPPGVDTVQFRCDRDMRSATRNRLQWPSDVPVVGFLGRLVPEKGLDVLMRALDRLRTPWRALIVGAGPLERDLRAWASRYGDRVAIDATVRHADVPAYLNAMDVLCAPSQTLAKWREQFGRMLVEAFACGVPVVASASGEIPHVVGDAGILLSESDVDAWAATLDALLPDAARRGDLARRGRQRAEALFAWPIVARRHLDFFDRVIADRRAA
jgi:glycosyltransferase involved in cell wall biosynthesis